jgi:hypothetical protein
MSASALFLAVAALCLLSAPAQQAGRAAGADDCVLSRDAGTAAPRCYALNAVSPYATGGLGGSRIGADSAALDRMSSCVQAGDTRSPGCTMGAAPAAVTASPRTPNGLRFQ